MSMNSKHLFSIYIHPLALPIELCNTTDTPVFVLTGKTLVHRLTRILRLQTGDHVELFDKRYVAQASLQEITKSVVRVMLHAYAPLQKPTPSLTVLLPILKRDALNQAIYTCVEMSVNDICLMYTEKTHGQSFNTKEEERMQAVMVAAAEQSKQYVLPTVHAPKLLSELIATQIERDQRLCLDPHGTPLFEHLMHLRTHKQGSITLTFGPEGDFTPHEKTLLKSAGFQTCALTKTTLRAQQALVVALGALRSCIA